jgi:thiamine-phosphate pyrophosphorylase
VTSSPDKKLLYLISSGEMTGPNFNESSARLIDLLKIAVHLHIPLIQLREKSLSTRDLCRLAEKVMTATRGSETKVLINDRADIAAAVEADGVHLASQSLSASTVGKHFPSLIIGVSTHTLSEVLTAEQDGADLVVYGPVFETPGKGPAVGTERLRNICSKTALPVLGLGGIAQNNFQPVLDAGAAGIAAIRWLNDPEQLRIAAKGFGYGQ